MASGSNSETSSGAIVPDKGMRMRKMFPYTGRLSEGPGLALFKVPFLFS